MEVGYFIWECIDKIYDFIKNEKPVQTFADLKKQDVTHSADYDMALVNPNYNPGGDYDDNCSLCSFAYELRRRGYDVEAADENTIDSALDATRRFLGVNIETGFSSYDYKELYINIPKEQTYSYNYRFSGSIDNINLDDNRNAYHQFVDKMVKYGDGARGMINVKWSTSGGHSMAWEIENKELIVRDSQTNGIRSLESLAKCTKGFRSFRTDNLEINEVALKYVRNRDGK